LEKGEETGRITLKLIWGRDVLWGSKAGGISSRSWPVVGITISDIKPLGSVSRG